MLELIAIQEIWLNFRQLLSTFRQLMLSEVSPSKLQTTTIYGEVTAYLEQQLLPVAEQELPVAIAGKMRSYITEVHRLVKLLQRDLIFWYSAQQSQIEEQRRLEILAKLEVITGFAQSMMEELAMAIDL